MPNLVVWAGAGIALALVSLFGCSLLLTQHGARRALAGIAWLFGLAFTITGALGSQHGGRELAARTDGAITGERARLEAAYRRASDELAALPPARPAPVINTELSGILKDVKLQDCRGWLESKKLRAVCVKRVEPLRTEQATALSRQRLQTAIGRSHGRARQAHRGQASECGRIRRAALPCGRSDPRRRGSAR